MTIVKAVEGAGGALVLLGGAVGAYGTYLQTRWYLPFGFLGLLRALAEIVGKLLRGKKREAIAEIENEAEFAEALNPENRATSLFGIYLVLIGFAVQVMGAALGIGAAMMRPQ